jgi:hypothetical protein
MCLAMTITLAYNTEVLVINIKSFEIQAWGYFFAEYELQKMQF